MHTSIIHIPWEKGKISDCMCILGSSESTFWCEEPLKVRLKSVRVRNPHQISLLDVVFLSTCYTGNSRKGCDSKGHYIKQYKPKIFF